MRSRHGLGLGAFLWACWPAQAQTIAVDVGHYLEKPGAISARGKAEFDFNLELAQKIAQALQAKGFEVKLVGEHGRMKDLKARTRAAAKADFFLSVHHDSVQPRYLSEWEFEGASRSYGDRYSGFSLFVSRKNPQLAPSLECASALGSELIRSGFKPSRHHAEPIPGENRTYADQANGVHYYDDLVVLKTARQPALLLEAGIIVNREDELTLSVPATREKIAAAVATALDVCTSKTD
ncbi:MAG: N-acetylmuramoyl-L-alanine amidase [Methylococcaceae bacterium]|nr:N-acetylmuramoyl-L-alanine amidase [Methylococcaceae bacterium]